MFKTRLRDLRLSRGLQQKELAAALNLDYKRYNHYETGRSEPDNHVLSVIADFFDVSIDYLLGRSDSPTPARDNLLKMAAQTDDPEELLALLDIVNKKLQERK